MVCVNPLETASNYEGDKIREVKEQTGRKKLKAKEMSATDSVRFIPPDWSASLCALVERLMHLY